MRRVLTIAFWAIVVPLLTATTSVPTPPTATAPTSLSSAQRDALYVCPHPVVATGLPAPAVVRASGWLVADLDTGAVLAQCDAHRQLAPASTIKVLTALALLPVVPASAAYVGRDEDARIDGTRAGIVPGQHYTGDQLWHGLLMGSANDCAQALAQLAGGDAVAKERMDAVARSLGAYDTVVVNTSGLDADGQVSSAFDLALFGRAALADQQFERYSRTLSFTFPGKIPPPSAAPGHSPSPGKDPGYLIANHNRLLHNYPGATGVKNGYTVAAGGAFIGSATRSGHSYVVTVLHSDGNTWREVAALLDWAFAHGAAAGTEAVADLDTPPVPSPTTAAAGAPGGPGGATAAPALGAVDPNDATPSSGLLHASWQFWAGFAVAAVGGGLVAAGAQAGRRRRRGRRLR
jgi:serine-type D-Ala-D-Ala carboxypeptidase (penicillin-binding protein 5/6)